VDVAQAAGTVAITGASLRFARGVASLQHMCAAAAHSVELHSEAPFERFDADDVLHPLPGKVRGRCMLSAACLAWSMLELLEHAWCALLLQP
jgi:hypothetical protein